MEQERVGPSFLTIFEDIVDDISKGDYSRMNKYEYQCSMDTMSKHISSMFMPKGRLAKRRYSSRFKLKSSILYCKKKRVLNKSPKLNIIIGNI